VTSPGTIRGRCILFNTMSNDMATSGPARYEIIPPDAVIISPDIRFDSHHFEASAFAFSFDGSGRAWVDDHGVAFEATLPPTRNGYDVANALKAGLRLGVSATFAGLEHERDTGDGVAVVRRAEIVAISIMSPGRAVYPQPACWLASASPESLPADVQELRRHWRAPSLLGSVRASAERGRKAPLFSADVLRAAQDVRAGVMR
jgi:hypothetical protein